MKYKNVTVAGSGVLGYQIAFQAAFHNFKVTIINSSFIMYKYVLRLSSL